MAKKVANLRSAWNARWKLHAKGSKLGEKSYELLEKRGKLHEEANKLLADSEAMQAKSIKLHEEANKLLADSLLGFAERSNVYAKASKLWVDAVHDARGNTTTMKWTGPGECILGTGERFTR